MSAQVAILIDNISLKAGTERAVVSLCNGLVRHQSDIEMTIISVFSSEKSNVFFSLDPAVKIIHLNHPNHFTSWNKVFYYQELINRIKKINSNKQYSIMMGSTYVLNMLLPFITKKTKTKTIGCEHEIYGYAPKIIQSIRKLIYPKLNRLVVLNEMGKNNFSFLNNVSIIPNSLPFVVEKKSKLNQKKIIAAGRLTYQKGFDLLIDVMAKVVRKYPDWTLDIYGEGEDWELLQNKINSSQLQQNICLKGNVQNMQQCYAESTIFTLTSRWESFGLVLIEAMNAGLPCVSFDCDGPKNIINNQVNGFLISNFDTAAFAEKIIFLIENKDSRANMSQEAIHTSTAFEEQNIIPLWIQLMHQI